MWIVVYCFSVKLYVRNIAYTVAVDIRKLQLEVGSFHFFIRGILALESVCTT